MPSGIYKRTKRINIGKKPWNKGLKGFKQSKETIKKRVQSRKGYRHSKTTKEKIRKSLWQGGISKTSNKRWRERNYEKVLFYNTTRMARKKGAEGDHTLGEWQLLKKQYGYRCPCCGKQEPEIKLTEDHIIPLSKGGSNYIENIQPLCKSCNCKKHTKIIKYVSK